MKKASGKPRATAIIHNVFGPAPAEQACQISYSVGGVVQIKEWAASGEALGDIRAIDIFDSEEGNFYLTKESAVAYTPPILTLFTQFVEVCDRVKAVLQVEQDRLTSKLPKLPPAFALTPVSLLYSKIGSQATPASAASITSFSKADEQRLHDLSSQLKVDDPSVQASRLRNTKGQTAQIAAAILQATNLYGEAGIQRIRQLGVASASKRKAAVEAATVGSSKLEHIGSTTWLAMWNAAREYSKTVYIDRSFPVTDDSVCVLCHQDLLPDAKQRLKDFDSFVQSTIEEDARQAESIYRQALAAMPAVPTKEQIGTQAQAAGLDDGWVEYLEGYWKNVLQARDALRDEEFLENAIPVLGQGEACESLKLYQETLERDAIALDGAGAGFDRAKASAEKLNLEAKLWISQQREAIEAEVARQAMHAALDVCKGYAGSRKVSIKAGEISQQLITKAYERRFNSELRALGASGIKVEMISTRTERGRPLHQLRLKGSLSGNPFSVLSEGERRIVSLAAFLADVTSRPRKAPFIFDDPISSLDHEFEWCVAERLVALAKSRQVIVLTHRLSLYGALEELAKKEWGDQTKRDHLSQHCIEAFGGTAGHPVDQQTWNANNKEANNILITRLQAAKKAGESGGAVAYNALAQGVCSDFRKLLERTIETDLINDVVKRHRRSIQTDGRLFALPKITREDCEYFDDLMTRYSTFEHSQSTETPIQLPEAEALAFDLENLKIWRKEFSSRSTSAPA